jgi:autotransporter-associated beta strand protein
VVRHFRRNFLSDLSPRAQLVFQGEQMFRHIKMRQPNGARAANSWQLGRGLLVLWLCASLNASAAPTNHVWQPAAGGNNRWSRANNWAANLAPPQNNVGGLTNTDLTFSGTLKLAPVVDGTYYVHSLNFDSQAGAFVIVPQNGAANIRLGAGGISNNSTNNQTVAVSLVLSNAQTWSASGADLNILGAVNLGNHTLTLAGPQDLGLLNAITGAGGLLKTGSGNLTMGGIGANTFSGGFTIADGTVTVNKNNALGSGPLTLTGGILDLGNYNLGVSSILLQGGTVNSASGAVSSSADYQLESGTVNTVLSGSGGVVKTTSGTVTLTRPNAYSGDTRIFGGTLVVNNTTGSGTGSGNVWIGSGGLLSGTGSISGLVTNSPGGSFSAGNEVGALTLGSTVWFGGATNRWDLANATGTAGVGWDLLNINGTLTIDADASNPAVIDLFSFTSGGTPGLADNFDGTQAYWWVGVHTTGGINFNSGESVLTAFRLWSGNFLNQPPGSDFTLSLSQDGNSLYVNYVPVPEPAQGLLLGLGLSVLIIFNRSRFQRRLSRE